MSGKATVVPQHDETTPFFEAQKLWNISTTRMKIADAVRKEFWKGLRYVPRRVLGNALARVVLHFRWVYSWELELSRRSGRRGTVRDWLLFLLTLVAFLRCTVFLAKLCFNRCCHVFENITAESNVFSGIHSGNSSDRLHRFPFRKQGSNNVQLAMEENYIFCPIRLRHTPNICQHVLGVRAWTRS